MSYDEYLELDTKLTLFDVLEALFPAEIAYDYDQAENYITCEIDGMTVFIDSVDNQEDAFSERFDIAPTISICFAKAHTLEVAEFAIQVMLTWLENTDGDAALISKSGTVKLMRKEGKLTRNSRAELWTPETLGLVTLKHKKKYIL